MSSPNKKIVITGGGTGGHVFPALAMADELSRRGHTVLYVGSEKGMESKLVREKGYLFFTVKSGAVKNQGVLKIIRSLWTLLGGVAWAIRFLRHERPTAVVGVGGYVSVPVSVAAFLCRIPLYLQEQNVSVGIANRFLGRLATKCFLGFEQAAASFPHGRAVVTGNPIRREFYEAAPAYDPNRKCLLVVGGSQGARAINELITGLLEVLAPTFPGISIVHQTGQRDLEQVQGYYNQRFHAESTVTPFITDVASAYRNASVVVARSGALTVSELIQLGRPAIFIPFPRQGQNDQTANAYYLERHGAARVVEQGDHLKERFWAVLLEVFRPETLAKMEASYQPLRRANAVTTICDLIESGLV